LTGLGNAALAPAGETGARLAPAEAGVDKRLPLALVMAGLGRVSDFFPL
jgi:hypothetical protein